MNISKGVKKSLERLGMSQNEIRAYVALLEIREATAEQISEKSGVSYSKIYEALNSMEEGDWVSSDDSRPARYSANSPAAGVGAAKRRMEGMMAEDEATVSSELEPLYEKTGTAEAPEILFLRGTGSIISKILETADSCEREMMIAVPAAGQEIVRQALPKLRVLHDRGVKTTILTSREMDADSRKALSRVAAVRIKDGIYGGGMISDKRCVVILLGSEGGKAPGQDAVAIWADHAGLAGFASEYFEYLIRDSDKVL